MAKFDESVPIVCVQFSFSNQKHVPTHVREIGRETPENLGARKSTVHGAMVISPTKKCSVLRMENEILALVKT